MDFKAKMENTVILWFMCENRVCKYFSDLFPFFYDPAAESYVVWVFFSLLLSAVYLR